MNDNISNLKTVKWIGIVLFFIGVMITISAGAKMPVEGATYPNTMPGFFIGAILGIVGLVCWHVKQRAIIKLSMKDLDHSGKGSPIQLLKSLNPKLAELSQKLASLDNESICKEVDVLLDDIILPMADERQQIIDLLGMSKGAEVLVTIAFGERMLNRVWSAASDGHSGEANSVFPDAVSAFSEAQGLLDRAL